LLAATLAVAACGGTTTSRSATKVAADPPAATWPASATSFASTANTSPFASYLLANFIEWTNNSADLAGANGQSLDQVEAEYPNAWPDHLTRKLWTCVMDAAQSEPGETPYKWQSDVAQWGEQEYGAPYGKPSAPSSPDISYALSRCGLN
jgi:hypothetical protein